MKIALFGYGKMGKEIEKIALRRQHEIVLKIDQHNSSGIDAGQLRGCDVAIEFSTPHTAVGNILRCFEADLPVVVGTTGWYDQFGRVRQECEKQNGSLFHATNFSLGVNLFFKVNRYLAGLMSKYEQYDVSMEEIHHIHKLDKPSGTAITLAEQIIAGIGRKKSWSISERRPDVLHIHDVREGEVPGTHIVRYQSDIDDIEIQHKAHNRSGFALGAVLAAEHIRGKKGIFTMEDLV